MRLFALSAALLLAASCTTVTTQPAASVQAPPAVSRDVAVRNFAQVIRRVEPVAEQVCRERTSGLNCDYNISVDTRADQPPNAYQTRDRSGRPQIVLTASLIADTRNSDELAFVVGHEAAHHIENHLPRKQQSAVGGAVLGGVLGAVLGGGEMVRAGADLGSSVGARAYSKEFELEADALGTVIAHRAGFNPVRGAQYFARIPDPGDRFLGTHPPNASRMETVRRTAAALR
ncbi:peptidase M48 [Maritimibacter sp. 55A14]|uniref:M48 family metallopeptidase n=1 Tax=Maritimibacter sp. 55A14 TaxID=2174844 RepID=UPI000D61D9FC|nr:M48 family metallopeptidase [Maritimibacter sp. 55A14]PWE33692.1 peptidase M48 [Maritimibacter sp. 55A14]